MNERAVERAISLAMTVFLAIMCIFIWVGAIVTVRWVVSWF